MPNRRKREHVPHRDSAARLGAYLRDARESRQLTQQQLADLASVAIGTVQALERKRSVDPSLFTVIALARALSLDLPDVLATVDDNAAPESSSADAVGARTSAVIGPASTATGVALRDRPALRNEP